MARRIRLYKVLKRQAIHVIAILLSAILFATVLSISMILYYGSSRSYLAGNAILSPDTMKKLHYKDLNFKTGQTSHFIFNAAEFSYFDKLNGQLYQKVIDLANYERFYSLIATNRNLEKVGEEIEGYFNERIPATLTLTVRADNGSSSPLIKLFQTIQFSENDYFRIQLRDGSKAIGWIYFYQPHIFQDMIHLFTKT